MKKIALILSLLLPIVLSAQEKYILSGYISDSVSGLPLYGASVHLKENNIGSISDTKGYFEMTVNKGNYTLIVSFLGYKTYNAPVYINRNKSITINLSPEAFVSNEVVITDKYRNQNVTSIAPGSVKLNRKEIEQLPALLGNPDPIKVIQFLPGVTSGNDAGSGFNVRGSNTDQNLIIIDNIPVYNPSHVLGFFSVFNHNIIKELELIKSGIPANYGGRLSSIFAIESNDGDFNNYSYKANIGLISSDIYVEGPIVKEKLSFHFAGRRTYLDQTVKPAIRSFIKQKSIFYDYSKYHFYDLNARMVWKASLKDQFAATFYSGTDKFTLNQPDNDYFNELQWGNTILGLNWKHIINDNTYLHNTFGYTTYNFNFHASQKYLRIGLFSNVEDFVHKLQFIKFLENNNKIEAGMEYQYHRFSPNNINAEANEFAVNFGKNRELSAHEMALFANADISLSQRIKVGGGLRISGYAHVGPYTEYKKNFLDEITDTNNYAASDILKTYYGFEPRTVLRYLVSKNSSVKLTYTRHYQYIHLVSSGAVTLPTDIWMPSTKNIKPQIGNQLSVGYFFDWFANTLGSSVDLYYKSFNNQIEVMYGIINDYQDNTFEESMTFGKGHAYGMELFLKKQTGKTTGWISYTISRTVRQFDEINEGKIYPAKFDRLHDVNLVINHQINDKLSLSATFIYATGNAMTLPAGRTILGGNVISLYGDKNGFRLPAYHRLDVSASYILKQTPRYKSSLNFSIFNVYNRSNPYYIYFEVSGNIYEYNLEVKAKQVSMFPLLPSINWIVSF